MQIKIATLMAVYRGDNSSELEIALDSVLAQIFTDNVESRLYLAIDGPVTDEINRVIAVRENKIYRILRLDQNRGLATALNSLIKLLSDEVFVFRMDSDDRSHSNRYQTQLNYFKDHAGIDILGTDMIEIDTQRGTHRRVSFCSGPDDAIAKLCQRVPVAHPTVCFRRRVLDRVGGYPLAGTNEDVALWFRCAHEGFRFDNVKQPLLDFTINSNFWSRRSYKKSFSEFRCYAQGIWTMEGFTWKYVYPLARFLMRIAPSWLARRAYNSRFRG